ncbi:MAG: hypothetical protein AAB921_03475 [Patescibacteria group bacterium]
MKKHIIGTALAVLVSGQALPALAQTTCPTGVSSITVLEGETLWGYKGDAWPQLYQLNPSLDQQWRRFTTPAGGPGVRLGIGETVCGVTRDGTGAIVPQGSTVTGQSTAIWAQAWDMTKKYGPWALLLAFVLGALVLAWLFNELRKHPVNSGPRIRENGVNTIDEARERFNEMSLPHAGMAASFQIRDVVAGRISGEMLVRYKDDTEYPRTVHDLPAYSATAVFNDGRTEQLYMLQACGNDLRFGGVLRYVPGMGFQFTPAQVEVAPAAPIEEVAQPAVAERVPAPTAANEEAVAEVPVTERVGPTFACYGAHGDKPPMITFDHTKVNVVVEGAMTTIRFLNGTSKEDSALAESSEARAAS